jgi:Protein of unknown function (DUF1524)
VPRRVLFLVVLVSLAVGAVSGPATAQQRDESMRLRAAVRALPVAAETPSGYHRDRFEHWVDADGDCQDTREEVLVAESRTPLGGCTVTTGEWFSWYDGATWTSASDVDIDHLVALKEAWDSGARGWSDATRERYANDLGDPRALVAVTDNVNQSKGDRDVAEWLPDLHVCRYVRDWVAVKLRWGLAVDPAEKAELRRQARRCGNRVIGFAPVTTAARAGR